MAKASKKVIDALTAIPGVGEATAKKLAAAGMSSKSDVVKAGLKGLKAAGLTAGTASKIAKSVASSKAKAVTKKAKAVATFKSMAQNDAQKQLIDQLFHAATESNQKFSDFTVGSQLTGSDTPLVILRKDDPEISLESFCFRLD